MSVVRKRNLENIVFKLEDFHYRIIRIFYGSKIKRNEIEDLIAEHYILILFNLIFSTNMKSIFNPDKIAKEELITHLYKTLESGFLSRSFNKVKKEKGPYLSAICSVIKKNKSQKGGGLNTASFFALCMFVISLILNGRSIDFLIASRCGRNPVHIMTNEDYKEYQRTVKLAEHTGEMSSKLSDAQKEAQNLLVKQAEKKGYEEGYNNGQSDAASDPRPTAKGLLSQLKRMFPREILELIQKTVLKEFRSAEAQLYKVFDFAEDAADIFAEEIDKQIDEDALSKVVDNYDSYLEACEESAEIEEKEAGWVYGHNTVIKVNPLRLGISDEDCAQFKGANQYHRSREYYLRDPLLKSTKVYKNEREYRGRPNVRKGMMQDTKKLTQVLDRTGQTLMNYGKTDAARILGRQQDTGSALVATKTDLTQPQQQQQQKTAEFLTLPSSGGKRKLKVTKRMKKKNRRTKKRSN